MLRSLCSLLVCAAVSASCRPQTEERYFGTTERWSPDWATFYVNNYDEPETLDPGMATDRAATTLLNELFEGLALLHPEDMHPIPGVAERWDRSDDNRHFRFYLREDARWSDGRAVTAHDFVYAWRRVLEPGSGCRMATLLHRLRNGKLYNQDLLRRVRENAALRARPASDGATGDPAVAGSAVRVRMTSPARVASAISPLAEPPDGVTELHHTAAPKSKPEAERLRLGAEGPTLEPPADDAWPVGATRVVRRGSPVKCNGAPDHWYELAAGQRRGYLPGCLLEMKLDGAEWMLVEPHGSVPTFATTAPGDESEPAATEPAARPSGWLPAAVLERSPELLGVRAVDDRTLEVELGEPTPYFLELTSYPTLFPVRRDVIERFAAAGQPDRWYRPDHIVVNGPYTLDSWRFRYEIRMKQNPHYHGRHKLAIERIVWMQVADHHANMNLYKTGELDFIGANVSLPAAYMEPLSKLDDFRRSQYVATYFYMLNVSQPPLDDVRVRQALNLAIDKALLVQTVTRSEQMPATHIVPDYTGSGYAEAVAADRKAGRAPFRGPGYDFDPARARELLGEAGYPVERDDEGRYRAQGLDALEILYNTSEGHRKIAVAVQDMWKKHLGITVSLRNEEWKVMLKSMMGGRYQVGRFSWTADYNHPHSFLETLLSYSPQNWTRWNSPEFDTMLEQAAATADPERSISRYREAERIAVDAMPLVPLYFYTKSTLVKPYVKGFYENSKNEHLVRFMWLDPSWKQRPGNTPAHPIDDFPPPGRY